MTRTNGAGRRTDLPAAIKDVAWRQIADHGAAALSLRAIARELGITAPAIYNYYPRRDDLVTALVIDAFTAFGDAQLAARDAVPSGDGVGRLVALGLAYRQWALSNPPRYQLIFGPPLPGYAAPPEKVQPSGVRALSALVGLVEDLRAAGRLRAGDLPDVTRGCEWAFDVWLAHDDTAGGGLAGGGLARGGIAGGGLARGGLPGGGLAGGGLADGGAACGEVSPQAVSVALIIWARVHGLVSLEIAGHLPPFGAAGDALYRYELAAIAHQFILEGP